MPRLGPKAFEQCAGFLRIAGGDDPLDASGVHPEAYPVVRKILAATKSDIKALIGNAEILREIKPQNFVDDTFGLPTVPTSCASWKSPAAIRARPSRRRCSRRASRRSRISSAA